MLPDRHVSGYTVRAMGKVTAAHLLVRTLKRHGIERIFGLCGDHVNSIFNACLDEGVAIVDTRHESGATHLADGWARVTGQPGVAVVTGGPGHTNSLTRIATARSAAPGDRPARPGEAGDEVGARRGGSGAPRPVLRSRLPRGDERATRARA